MASGPYLDEIAELVDAGKVGPPRTPFPGNCVVGTPPVDCAPGLIPGNTAGGGRELCVVPVAMGFVERLLSVHSNSPCLVSPGLSWGRAREEHHRMLLSS